jgi:DNA-binding transcriptional ArsR family regulator
VVIALNVASARREDLAAGTSPLAELMACLHVLAEPSHHPEAHGWTERVMAKVGDSLRSDLYRFSPLWARYRLRLFYPTTDALDRTLESELTSLAQVDDELFLPLTANAIRGMAFTTGGAEEVLESRGWVRDCEQRSFTRGDLAHSLVADPARFRAELIDVLSSCATAFFDEEWRQAHGVLANSAKAIAHRIRDRDPSDVLTSLTPMASSRGSTDTVFFDKLQSASATVDRQGLLLVPSLRGWPHVMVKLDPGLPVIVQFLVQEQSAKGGAQSQADLRNRLQVLSEPARWELCRHLIGEAITTTELAVRTGSTKSAVSRHLRHMRDAGLISSHKDGRQVFHRLPPSVIVHLGQDVLRGLMR